MRQLKNFSKVGNENKSDKEFINEAINKYGGMKEDDLIKALLDNVSKSKAAGTYNQAQMNSFIQTVSPYISAEQRERLNNVIKLINSEDVR